METIVSKSIFNPASGFARRAGFDVTCNPYVGCPFGCSYCYAAFLPQNRRPVEQWGRWFQAKTNAVELAQKAAAKMAGKAIYLSTVTDPYIWAEQRLRLTRGILEALAPHQPRLLVQTRGPLVVRDIDLLSQFNSLRINVSLPTDSDSVRRRFEPKAPPLSKRWEMLWELKRAGLPIGISIAPMLPLKDPEAFARRLAQLAPEVVATIDFHRRRTGVGADTGPAALEHLAASRWTDKDYRRSRAILRRQLKVHEAEAGFFPPPTAGNAKPAQAAQQQKSG